jgi:hypothetical protein
MNTYFNFKQGIAIVPKAASESNLKGEIEFLSTDNKLRVYNGSVNDPVVTETATATLTNKTLTGNIAANLISGSGTIVLNTTGTITVPNATDTLVGKATTDTLTNKSISGSTNTLSNIANASLVNSSITINGSSVSLGGSITISGSTDEPLTIGNGLLGGSFDGSTPVTIEIDTSVVATLTGIQTLTNKTLTSPVITGTMTGSNIDITGTLIVDTSISTPELTVDTSIQNNGTLDVTGVVVFQDTLDVIGSTTLGNVFINGNTITTSTGTLTVSALSGSNTIIDANGAGSVLLQKNASTVATIAATGITLGSARNIVFANNSQTVTLNASGSASASYTVTWPAASPTAGTAMIYNGTTYVWGNAGGWTPSTSASLTAGGTISISLTTGQQVIDVASSGGAVTLSTTPFGTSAPNNGTVIRLIGGSDSDTVQIINNDAQYGCILNGDATLFFGYVIELQWLNGYDRWFETSRNF